MVLFKVTSQNFAQYSSSSVKGVKQLGFTLIELMIVVAIIAVLLALMLPNMSKARQQAILSSCESNVRNIAAGLELYNTQYKRYPPNLDVLVPNYMKKATCPTNKSDYGYECNVEVGTFTVHCCGIHYLNVAGVEDGYPLFTPMEGMRRNADDKGDLNKGK